MSFKDFFIIIIACAFGVDSYAQQISGKVHCKGNGLKGVVVTDGAICTTTDTEGKYTLQSCENTRFVYISTPSGYLTDIEDKTIPHYYKEIKEGVYNYDFELRANPKDDKRHKFIVQADVQMSDDKDLNQYKAFLPKCSDFIVQNSDIDIFGFDCGDISGDNLDIIPRYIDAVSTLDIPIYRSIGNHDMDYNGRTHETSYKTFEENFGPVYFSFNKGNAHYIVINNSFFIGREYFYMGYINEKTFRWLEQDLSFVKHDSPVFVILHIPTRLSAEHTPFSYTSSEVASQTINAKPLYELLKPYRANIISGHLHYSQNVCHNDRLFEHITPAVSGAWWQGDICLDGSPMGFGVYEVDGNDVKWFYKGFNQPVDYQFKIYKQGRYKDYPEDIVVNVWNWDPAWKVEWYENNEFKGEMFRFTGFDADAIALCSKKLKYNWISPVETGHLFRVKPEKKDSNIKIKVTDRFGNIFEKELKDEK